MWPRNITLDLAVAVPGGSATGIDISLEAVRAVKQNALNRGVDNCEFSVEDMFNLEWADGTFDIVLANQCLMHLPEPALALREMRQVCKVGGLVTAREGKQFGYQSFDLPVVIRLCVQGKKLTRMIGDSGTITAYPDIPYLTGYYDLMEKLMRSNGSQLNAGRHLVAWAMEAGFEIEQIQARGSVELYYSQRKDGSLEARMRIGSSIPTAGKRPGDGFCYSGGY
jgi:SAM-dependent methyltransferase